MSRSLPPQYLGQELKERRLAAGYGLRELADLVGMRPTQLANFEAGRLRELEEAHRQILCVLLDLPTRWGLGQPKRGFGGRS